MRRCSINKYNAIFDIFAIVVTNTASGNKMSLIMGEDLF